MGTDIDEMWARFILTDAEIQMISEQCDDIRSALLDMETAAARSDGKDVSRSWPRVVQSVEYLNAVFQAKSASAAHKARIASEDE